MHVKFYYMYRKLVNCIMCHEIRSIINYILSCTVTLPVVLASECQMCLYILSFFKLFLSHLHIILI